MKVYLVFVYHAYGDTTTIGVFDSLEKANAAGVELAENKWESNYNKRENDDGTLYCSNYDAIYSEIWEVE